MSVMPVMYMSPESVVRVAILESPSMSVNVVVVLHPSSLESVAEIEKMLLRPSLTTTNGFGKAAYSQVHVRLRRAIHFRRLRE